MGTIETNLCPKGHICYQITVSPLKAQKHKTASVTQLKDHRNNILSQFQTSGSHLPQMPDCEYRKFSSNV